jgi:1-acyl-sn-glycerol-3-phosphate acyltransferase
MIRVTRIFWWQVFYTFTVHGRDNLKGLSGPVLFVANHTSEWDGPLISSLVPFFSPFTPMFYVSLPNKYYQTADRDPLRRFLWGGTAFKIVGAWPVYPGTGDLNTALVHHLEILDQGGSITIFPEGRMTKDGSIGTFKVGASFLLAEKKVKVVPVAITGISHKIYPEGSKRPRISFEFGTPFQYPDDAGKSEEELKAFANVMRDKVLDMARKMSPLV